MCLLPKGTAHWSTCNFSLGYYWLKIYLYSAPVCLVCICLFIYHIQITVIMYCPKRMWWNKITNHISNFSFVVNFCACNFLKNDEVYSSLSHNTFKLLREALVHYFPLLSSSLTIHMHCSQALVINSSAESKSFSFSLIPSAGWQLSFNRYFNPTVQLR